MNAVLNEPELAMGKAMSLVGLLIRGDEKKSKKAAHFSFES